jgi:L-asparagine oxygenase
MKTVEIIESVEEKDLIELLSNIGEMSPENFGEREEISPGMPSRSGNSLSEYYGMGTFPFHSDVAYWPKPAKFLALYCKNPGAGNRKTRVIDLSQYREEIKKAISPGNDLFILKKRPFPFYAQVINGGRTNWWIRWDKEVMLPLKDSGVWERLEGLIQGLPILEINWSHKLLVLIDNRMCLHSRGESMVPDKDRVLKRFLMKEK